MLHRSIKLNICALVELKAQLAVPESSGHLYEIIR